CALLRKKFKEGLFTYCIEESFIVKQDAGENSLQGTPQINHHCCYGCGDLLEEPSMYLFFGYSSSSKIDSLFEFTGELALLKLIPPGINETDCDHEEETRLIKRLLYDNSSPRPPKEFISKTSNTAIESFSPSPIPVKDSDSLMKEINLSFTLDGPMPPDIEEDDYDSERDILILEEFLSNDSFHFLKMNHFILIFLYPLVLLQNHQMEKSPNFLSHLGHQASQPSTECPMMIYGRNTPILDVLILHFYPP
nr:hypothetical protein [Tanacetum cinerariifolium]